MGLSGRSAWLVPPLGALFAAHYALGRWPTWRATWRRSGLLGVSVAFLVTWLLQTLVVAVFFGPARALAAWSGRASSPLDDGDLVVFGSLAVFTLALGTHLAVIEAKTRD